MSELAWEDVTTMSWSARSVARVVEADVQVKQEKSGVLV